MAANQSLDKPRIFSTRGFPLGPHDSLVATYGMDVPSPHAADALFSVRVHMRGKEEVDDLTIRLKVPMRIWGHVKPWRD